MKKEREPEGIVPKGAVRDGGGSGDRLTDGVLAVLGQGNQYQRNGRKESRRNPTSKAYQQALQRHLHTFNLLSIGFSKYFLLF